MSGTLDDEYLEWLYHKVADPKLRRPEHSWWALFRQLYSTEFVWLIPNDDNRVEDGRNLRAEFERETGSPLEYEWQHLGCSVLEMLIALSNRLAFETSQESPRWFWELLCNVELVEYHDQKMSRFESRGEVEYIVERLIWRNYRYDGVNGLFPIRRPSEDQSKVEIWYQMHEYLQERGYI